MAKKPVAPARSKPKPNLSPVESLAVRALAGALSHLESTLGVNARPKEPLEQARRVFYLASKVYASGAIRPPTPSAKEFGPELLADPTYTALREALLSLQPAPAKLDPRVAKDLVGLAELVREMAIYAEAPGDTAAGDTAGGGNFGTRLAEASQRGLATIDRVEHPPAKAKH